MIFPLLVRIPEEHHSCASLDKIRTTYGFFTSLCKLSKMVCALKGLFCSFRYFRMTSYPSLSVSSFFGAAFSSCQNGEEEPPFGFFTAVSMS